MIFTFLNVFLDQQVAYRIIPIVFTHFFCSVV